MKTIKNANGTESHIYQYADACGIDLHCNGEGWTLIFYDDGDPVIMEQFPKWQLEHLRQLIEDEVRKARRPKEKRKSKKNNGMVR